MNFKEIIGPDELDWKVIPLDWKKIGKEELKLGTPMSRDGVEANDASCYGILMDDVQKDKHFQARVIVSGCVDFAKAEEYSGIKISAEAKKAIGKVWSQGGGGLTELPEGYPYKEQAFEDITWDGSAEGRDFFPMSGGGIVKVSDKILTENDLTGAKVSFSENPYVSSFVVSSGELQVQDGVIVIAIKGMGAPCVFAVSDVSKVATSDMPFPSNGVYFMYMDAQGLNFYVSSLTCEPIIHTMAPEFLPAGVGGGGVLRVNVTAVDGDVTNLTADKTYAEIVSAFEAGSVITAYFVLGTGYVFTLSQRGANHFLFHSIFTMSGSPVPMFLQIRNDDDVMLIESAFS